MDKKTIYIFVYYLYHFFMPIVFLDTFTLDLTLGDTGGEVSDAIMTLLLILLIFVFEIVTLKGIKNMWGIHLFYGWVLTFVTFYFYIKYFSI